MADVRARNRRIFGAVGARAYGAYMARPWLSRPVARVVWGSDIRPFYASLTVVGEMGDGATIVDVPCGAGVALRHLVPEQDVSYLALDLSPTMVALTERAAARRGLGQVRARTADAEALDLPDASADLVLSCFGLHCLPRPDRAVAEAARVLRPGGELRGSTILTGTRPLDRLRVRPGFAAFGNPGDEHDLRRWLGDAGLTSVEVAVDGLFATFSARR